MSTGIEWTDTTWLATHPSELVGSVAEFHRKYGHLIADATSAADPETVARRRRLISEEATELDEALAALHITDLPPEAHTALLRHAAKEMCDVLYTVAGAALELGIDLDRAFAEVHASCMTKDGGRNADGKTTKGPGYRPPSLDWIERACEDNA